MYSIGKASELSGVPIETIRYYERDGIVPQPDRTASGRRSYEKADVDRLRFIRRCRGLGLPTSEARSLLGLAGDQEHSCQSARQIASRHLDDVRNKIAELRRMEDALEGLIRSCDQQKGPCPLLNDLLTD
ncbi:MAG: helix-turn-helix domain-containing protein [Rhizobiaceae bacterium]